ncbi:MAG: glucose-1-phosphate thymidylyltransferase RfbA [Spirochaetales bacterium]|nr:glucose-1-phosphate thymidylyltransferase RfbA [Spirochaetales bacterium]
MKGIILAGCSGTRLYPITKVLSKQILPLYDKPMIYYPLSVLMLAKIREILIISTPRDIGTFEALLGDGHQLGLELSYIVQNEPKGLAQAFILGESFIGDDDVCLILGDNVFYVNNLGPLLQQAGCQVAEKRGGVIFGYYVNDPTSYGVAEFDKSGNVLGIEEKPSKPKSNYAIPGLYFYDSQVVDIAKNIKPSPRGELEITDVNNEYLKRGQLKLQMMGRGMAWLDTGTCDGLLEASNFIATIQKRQGLAVSCIEEIAFRNKWIDINQLRSLADEKTDYGKYIQHVAEGRF